MTLTSRELNDSNAALFDSLYEGRVTPSQRLLAEFSTADVSWQYIIQQLGQITDPDWYQNSEAGGVYEFVHDLRPASDTSAIEQFERVSEMVNTSIALGVTSMRPGVATRPLKRLEMTTLGVSE